MAYPAARRPGLHDQAWHYLLGLAPDIALLQEALPPGWVRTEGTLVHGPITWWGSVIFSPRLPLERFRLPEESNLHALGRYLAFATASLPDGSDALIASVHAVARKATKAQLGSLDAAVVSRRSAGRPRVNDVVFAGIEPIVREKPFIVSGDWNTARLFDSVYEGTAGAEFFDRAGERAWFECARKMHPEEVRTWFRPGNRPYQLDHAFCDAALWERLKDVRVGTDAAEELGLSDHAPLILDFDIASIAITNLNSKTSQADTT